MDHILLGTAELGDVSIIFLAYRANITEKSFLICARAAKFIMLCLWVAVVHLGSHIGWPISILISDHRSGLLGCYTRGDVKILCNEILSQIVRL